MEPARPPSFVADSGWNEGSLRRWLTRLRQPDKLSDPALRELLAATGRLPAASSPLALGEAAAQLLIEKIESLKPPPGSDPRSELPYLALQLCFVEGAKLLQVAARLGVSERQLSRERSRGLSLLRAELESAVNARRYRPEPIPAIKGLARPGQVHILKTALTEHHLVNVSGPAGIGKTSLVAELATELSSEISVLWYRFRSTINVSLTAVLLELGEYLADEGAAEPARYLEGALPTPDPAIASRLILRALGGAPRLIVLDDYHLAERDEGIGALLEELVSRLPQLGVITIGRHRYATTSVGTAVELAPFTRRETAELLTLLKVRCSDKLVKTLHAWTSGNPHLLKLAASWLKTATPEEVARGVGSLNDQSAVRDFLLGTVTELLDSDDRALLEAASIFRGRFADDVLAYVAARTPGAVMDASRRLERAYVATRSLNGQTAFFHQSVKEYIYSHLDHERKSELHRRAAEWYERAGDEKSANHHRALAASSS